MLLCPGLGFSSSGFKIQGWPRFQGLQVVLESASGFGGYREGTVVSVKTPNPKVKDLGFRVCISNFFFHLPLSEPSSTATSQSERPKNSGRNVGFGV